jgi:hypothetical protein
MVTLLPESNQSIFNAKSCCSNITWRPHDHVDDSQWDPEILRIVLIRGCRCVGDTTHRRLQDLYLSRYAYCNDLFSHSAPAHVHRSIQRDSLEEQSWFNGSWLQMCSGRNLLQHEYEVPGKLDASSTPLALFPIISQYGLKHHLSRSRYTTEIRFLVPS